MKNLKSLATGLKHTITTRKLEGDVIENYSMQVKSTPLKGLSVILILRAYSTVATDIKISIDFSLSRCAENCGAVNSL